MSSLTYTGWQMGAGAEEPLRDVSEFVDVESSDSDFSSDGSDSSPVRRRRRRLACAWGSVAGLTVAIAFGVLALLGLQGTSTTGAMASSQHQEAELGEKVLIEGTSSTAPTTTPSAAPNTTAVFAPTTRAAAPPATTASPPTPPPRDSWVVDEADLRPAADDLHDGNVCKDNEELFGGLCYKKCGLLTGGNDTIRTSPWTCCESHPCTVNQKLSIHAKVACTGFMVAGDGSCPHRPGGCLDSEELFLGVCYKKCSLLTEKEYPYRIAPATCCEDSGLNCLDFRKDYTSEEFAVGGGEDRPGACQQDEELLLGKCYKKCSLLTHGEYPLRFAFATCCKAHSRLPHKLGGVWHLGCLDPRQDKSSAAFDVAGDAPSAAVANVDAHYPLKNLTEQR